MLTSHDRYKKAFSEYLGKGAPIAISIKQAQTSTHYVWRTRNDSEVRSSHAANNGRIFSWNNPPPTGHPGKEFNCRCYAEPTNYINDAERIFGEVLLGHEGGFVDDPVDRGGATKYGVTIATWRRYARPLFGIAPSVATLRQITPAMASEIFWVGYWEPSRSDKLNDIELARLHSDTAYFAGSGNAARILQRAINRAGGSVSVDGAIGPLTLAAANTLDPSTLYAAYKEERWSHHERDIGKNPQQSRFRNGWWNRLGSFDAYH